MQEEKWWEGFTWVGWLNFILIQWFFVRLIRISWKGGVKERSGNGGPEYRLGYWGVIPLTGWWNDFRFIDGREGKK